MSVPDYRRSRFDAADEEPMGPLANLADIMLVFAVGLMVALAASSNGSSNTFGEAATKARGGVDISAGREMPELPAGIGEMGSGYESIGRVYRDPRTGKLVLIGEQGDGS